MYNAVLSWLRRLRNNLSQYSPSAIYDAKLRTAANHPATSPIVLDLKTRYVFRIESKDRSLGSKIGEIRLKNRMYWRRSVVCVSRVLPRTSPGLCSRGPWQRPVAATLSLAGLAALPFFIAAFIVLCFFVAAFVVSLSLWVTAVMSGALALAAASRLNSLRQAKRESPETFEGVNSAILSALFLTALLPLGLGLVASPGHILPVDTYSGGSSSLSWALTHSWLLLDTMTLGVPAALLEATPPVQATSELGERIFHLLKIWYAASLTILIVYLATPKAGIVKVGAPIDGMFAMLAQDPVDEHGTTIEIVAVLNQQPTFSVPCFTTPFLMGHALSQLRSDVVRPLYVTPTRRQALLVESAMLNAKLSNASQTR